MNLLTDRVERLAEFPKGCHVAQFLGKGFDGAVSEANAWETRTGNTCHKYFEQKLITKYHSIIVYYTRKEMEDAIS